MFKDAVRTLGRLVPPIRRLHDAALREHTGRMAAEAGIGRLRAEVEAQKGKPQIPVPDQEREQYARWANLNLKSRQQLIEIDFPVNPKARFGYGDPPEPIVSKLLEASQSRYEANIRALLRLVGPVVTIPPHRQRCRAELAESLLPGARRDRSSTALSRRAARAASSRSGQAFPPSLHAVRSRIMASQRRSPRSIRSLVPKSMRFATR